MRTFSLVGRTNKTVILSHRVIRVWHDDAKVSVAQEQGITTTTCDSAENARALVDEIQAWLEGSE